MPQHYQTGLRYTDAVHLAVMGKELAHFFYTGSIPRNRTTILQGGSGIAGYTLGVAVAVKHGVGLQATYQGHPIIPITCDAGFGYTGMELETLANYRLPAVVIVYNNNAWGTWSGQRNNQVGLPIYLFQENLRHDKLAEALGAHGEYVTRPQDFTPTLERAYHVARDEHHGKIFLVIQNGVSLDMQPYKDRVSVDDIWRLVNYLRSPGPKCD